MTNKLYIQRYILLKIFTGEWEKGNYIPSETFFSKKFDCSRLTARSAMISFVPMGLLKPKKGKGYIICGNAKKILFSTIISEIEFDDTKTYFFTKEETKKFFDDFKISLDHKESLLIKKTYIKENSTIAAKISILNKNLVIYRNKEILEDSITKTIIYNGIIPDKIINKTTFNNSDILKKEIQELGYKNKKPLIVMRELFSNNKLVELSFELIKEEFFKLKTTHKLFN
ncbi:MAG: GntR family transcriptional regulator [Mycoplasma sp.]|nr:GntR family transcriptional regulator [Mycoplasma sp.]